MRNNFKIYYKVKELKVQNTMYRMQLFVNKGWLCVCIHAHMCIHTDTYLYIYKITLEECIWNLIWLQEGLADKVKKMERKFFLYTFSHFLLYFWMCLNYMNILLIQNKWTDRTWLEWFIFKKLKYKGLTYASPHIGF